MPVEESKKLRVEIACQANLLFLRCGICVFAFPCHIALKFRPQRQLFKYWGGQRGGGQANLHVGRRILGRKKCRSDSSNK